MRPAEPAAAAVSLHTCDNSPSDGRAKHRKQHELRQQAGAHPPGQHIMRAKPQDENHAAKGERNRDRDQDRARNRGGARGA